MACLQYIILIPFSSANEKTTALISEHFYLILFKTPDFQCDKQKYKRNNAKMFTAWIGGTEPSIEDLKKCQHSTRQKETRVTGPSVVLR